MLATVAASTLDANTSPIVRIDADAEIRVELAGNPAPPLVCADAQRARYQPRLEGSALVFDQLSSGRYEIGLPEALSSTELRRAQGFEVFPLLVESGEVRTIAWNDAWTPLVETLSGSVSTIGIAPRDVKVVPRWGPLDLPLAGGDRMRRFPVADDGSFRLPGVRVRPTSLMFVREWHDGQQMPIGVGRLGEPCAVVCSPVSVSAVDRGGTDSGATAVASSVEVLFAPRIEGAARVLGWFEAFDTSSPLELARFPHHDPSYSPYLIA
ncbi:MAG: hypothetical protein WD226_09635, partial [Planctomycetota bacterium]